ATSMTTERTHIISDKITEESTYIVINDEATDNSKSEVNLERQLRSERTYIKISDETTNNSSCKVNLEEQLMEFESAYIIINDEATDKPKSEINLEEQLLDQDQDHNNILVFDTDSSDEESDSTFSALTLFLGQTFLTWDDAQKFLDSYGLEKGFSIRRKRTEFDSNKVLIRVGWECSCAGKYKAKKVLNPDNQRNRTSRATDCKWRVNGNLSKDTSIISFTTVVDEHNHLMTPSPQTNIAKYRKFGDDIVEFVEFCIYHGVTGAQSIGRLLKGKFPGRNIYQKSLYNVIQIAKKKLTSRVEYDASDLMRHLYSQRAEDSRWFIEAKFDGVERRLFPSVFESRWESLKEKYKSANSYIKRQLDLFKHKWAVCYTNNQFTAGANSTQRVESLNHKIHSCIKSNLSLLILVKEIQLLLDKESEYARVEEYKEQIPTTGLSTITKTYFNSIEGVISKYPMPSMVFVACNQMQECFYYDCFKIDITTINQDQSNIDYDEGLREDNYEVAKIHLTEIILTIGQNQILEIWRIVISCGTKMNYVVLLADGSAQAKWHIGLIAMRWYKDEFFRDSSDIWQQSFITLCKDSDHNQSDYERSIYKFDYIKQIRGAEVYGPVLREVNNTQQKYGRAHGIMRKALDLAISTNTYDELMGICHGFILDKQRNQESDEKMEDIENNIMNPVITARRGRPPGRAKSDVEVQDQRTTKRQRLQPIEVNQSNDETKDKRKTCQNCGNRGHNRATCRINKE
ncbi:19138_t:CDS:2, partial [Dentiscutata erythropus]